MSDAPSRPVVTLAGYSTLVGSRDVVDDLYFTTLQELAGEYFCSKRYRGRSGMAPGSDQNFYNGAKRSSLFAEVGFDNYLPDANFFNRPQFGYIRPDPENDVYDATVFTDTYERAQQLAFEARGSWEGLYPSGIRLHTRNAFQVYGHELKYVSALCMYWAIPVGRKGQVKGGTNTAVQLALKAGIPCFNLYYPDIQKRLLVALRQHQTLLCPESQQTLAQLLIQTPDLDAHAPLQASLPA